MKLSDLVVDSTVRAAASLFPTEVQIDSAGATGCRVIIFENPAGGWALGVWSTNPVGGVPVTVILEPIGQFFQYIPSRVHMVLVDGRQVVLTPGRGCSSCGGAASLRMYNPFGPTITIASVPGPQL